MWLPWLPWLLHGYMALPSLQGLWSNERGIAWPHELRQALESPQLACRRMNGLEDIINYN